jgi:hypothetical protein
MATPADIVRNVADRNVKRLTVAVESALRRGVGRVSESALASALASGSRVRATAIAEHAIEEADLRTLVREPIDDRLLDVAAETADATRCSVRPTTSPAEQLARTRPAADVAAQISAEASEIAIRRMLGTDTVEVTADIRRAMNSTPLRRPVDIVPSHVAVETSLREAASVAQFDATVAKVKHLYIADLKPTEPLVGDSELVVRYRSNLPVPPIVVNEDGTIIDGHKRAASAWAAGYDRIYAVVVRSDEGAMAMEWLRWNN